MYAILHEGKSIDKSFFQLLLDSLNLEKNDVQFYGMGSKINFFNTNHIQYQTLHNDILDRPITKILFIVDADDGFDETQDKLEKVIDELKLKEISDFYIVCDLSTNKGYLESLILSSIPQKQKECIETFLDCSEFKSKENHKAILNQIYKSAYPNAPYNFEHENFDELKEKLTNLFN